MSQPYHTPVLADEVVRLLNPQPGGVFLDGTLGGGGHARRIGEMLAPGGTLLVIDRDTSALDAAAPILGELAVKVVAIHGNFRDMLPLAQERGYSSVQGILLDIGVSSHMFDQVERGFSFRGEAPLDMRMDTTQGETAADLIARLDERELTRLMQEYGDERWAARIARFIVERREREPIVTTTQLVDIIHAAIPKAARPKDIHPATRAFQAFRIAVNDEIGALKDALEGGLQLLAPGGRIAVISYHSREDRLCKETFIRWSGRCQCPPGLPICMCGARRVADIITRKPVMPTEDEIIRNPRARSARLRVAQKSAEPIG